METVILVGAEDVKNASHRISSAASEMTRAAESIQYSLQQHHQYMDEWLSRLETIMKGGD